MSEPVAIVINTDVLPGADGMYRHDVLSEIRLPNQAELFIYPDPRVAELEYRLHKQAEVHAYEKEALQHQIKMLSDSIVRRKMLEPAPPILVSVDPRASELETVLRECREEMQKAKYSGTPYTSSYNRAIAKIDEVLNATTN